MTYSELSKLKCIEIALEIKKLLDEFEKIMPQDTDTIVSLNFVRYAMLSLSNRMHINDMMDDWGLKGVHELSNRNK